jgi:WS/DGAT/MGAT family acyltransferase
MTAYGVLPPEGSFERMTALDASFLHAETPRTPLHIGSLSVFEGAPFFDDRGAFRLDDVRRRVSERLHLFPRFRKRVATVAFGQGRPVWVDDEDFDIANHVKLMALPEPGSRAELAARCSTLQMRVLDRDHPLWELWFVGGLDDGNVAMVEKVHHAMIDGVSGVDVAAALLDLEPEPPPIDVPRWAPMPAPDAGQLLLESWRERIVLPAERARSLRAMVRTPLDLVRRVGGVADALGSEVAVGVHHTSLKRQVGMTRDLQWVTVPLGDVRRTAHQLSVTVNDVVLAAVAGGLRALLVKRGEDVTHLTLQCLVPVSTRSEDEHGALGNRVSAIFAPLPVHEDAPMSRVSLVHEAMVRHKERHEADGTELLLESIELLPPALLALTSRTIHRQPLIDVVVTNVPGPACPLYFMGSKMLESVPVVPLGGNLSIGIAILSYDGDLTVGIHADGEANPDLHVLTDALRGELAELAETLR